jgi:aryl-alcohol dehydrogenase-like predicted oxidoreductase
MNDIHLGRTGLLTSRIGLGAMNFGDVIDEEDQDGDAVKAIRSPGLPASPRVCIPIACDA